MRISEHVRFSTSPDGAVLMDVAGGSIFSLNEAGAIVWQELAKRRSLDQIAEGLASKFEIPVDQAFTDVSELVEQLKTQKLLVTSESKETPNKKKSRSRRLLGALFGSDVSEAGDGGEGEHVRQK